MRLLFILLIIFLYNLCSFAEIKLIKFDYQKIIGVQVFNLSKEYYKNLDYYFKTLKSKGVNAVFIRVFQNKGDRYHYGIKSICESGVYFKTDQACTVYDILPEFIEYGKKYNIKIFAWMGTRKLTFFIDKYGVSETFKLNKVSKRVGYGADVFRKEVYNDLKNLFLDLAKYEIDGVLLQDDFILRIDESSSVFTLNNFNTDYDVYLDGELNVNEIPDLFFSWKTEALSDLLNDIKWDMKKINPKLKFAVNIYYETLIDKKKGERWYGQSIENYNKKGFSYFANMLYSEQVKKEMNFNNKEYLSFLDNTLKKWTNLLDNAHRFIAKIQIRRFDNKQPIDKKFFNNVCNLVKKYDVSYILVPFENLDDLEYICN
ncbi:hypothetical protein OWM07_06770 [Deferribacter thermophilus]|uniref:poly-beta-1,6-N-acetyl-D-glucosamine N-deacetylase PgaB n=1 Tax=Deferribacter thermophilus TaxID=53573 RepID=UPI003C178B49